MADNKYKEHPVDFVVTWVDGNDPVWQAEKAKYMPPTRGGRGADSRVSRFRDWDNMQYWFRAVEKFAPWVRKIHFVTCGHLPKWLNTDNPRLHIAKHSEFIPAGYLPTFSSQPIELNIHRIKGLAERFVYFNDDMFLLQPVKRELFFAGKDDYPTDFAITSTISTTTSGDMMPFIKLNCMTILNDNFDKEVQMKKHLWKWLNPVYGANALRNLIFMGEHRFKGFANNHLAFSFLKSEYEDIWNKEFDALDETSCHKFRSKIDLDNWLIRYWQLVRGHFEPIGRHVKGRVYEVYNGVAENQGLFDIIENQSMPMLCINDNDNIDFEPMKKRVQQAFNKILPEKSSFEK